MPLTSSQLEEVGVLSGLLDTTIRAVHVFAETDIGAMDTALDLTGEVIHRISQVLEEGYGKYERDIPRPTNPTGGAPAGE